MFTNLPILRIRASSKKRPNDKNVVWQDFGWMKLPSRLLAIRELGRVVVVVVAMCTSWILRALAKLVFKKSGQFIKLTCFG